MKKLIIVMVLIIALLFPLTVNASDTFGVNKIETSIIFRGILDVSLGVWGLTRNTGFGYVAGGLLLLRGTVILIRF